MSLALRVEPLRAEPRGGHAGVVSHRKMDVLKFCTMETVTKL